MIDQTKHPEWSAAWAKARAENPNLARDQLWRVEDAWGGYWQCPTEHGAYTFRVAVTRRGIT